MRILGVDPGTVATGWGVVEDGGRNPRCVDSGVIRARGELPVRLAIIHAGLERVIAEHAPAALSIEKAFVSENVQSAFRLGEARGVVLLVAAQAKMAVFEYAPAEVKMAVVGYGRALKEQVQMMIAQLLDLGHAPAADEADALAAALCHLNSRRLRAQLGAVIPRRRRPLRPAAAPVAVRVVRRGRE